MEQTFRSKFYTFAVLFLACCFWSPDHALAKPYKAVKNDNYERYKEKFYRNGFGVEIGAGNYNGLTYSRRFDRTKYLQSMLGFRLFQSELLLTTDFIKAYPRSIPLMPIVTPHIGAGIIGVFFKEFESLLGTEDDQKNYLGLRLPLGASVNMNLFDLPSQVYAEITPGMLVMPFGRPFLGITFGVRYLF